MRSLSYNIKIVTLFWLFVFFIWGTANAQSSVDEIKKTIDNHNEKIKQLDGEIKIYEKQIETVNSEAASLKNTIKVLDINQKKIGSEIKKTETNIQKTNLTITDLTKEIGVIEKNITANKDALSSTIADIYQNDNESIIEVFLNNKTLAAALDKYEAIRQFQTKIRVESKELSNHKEELIGKKDSTEQEKTKLVSLKSELGDQNKILGQNKKEKTTLLNVTQNKESEYKKILAQKQAEKEKFEQELFKYESALKKAIDPNSFPAKGKGIFSWPLDDVYITQYFGKTHDAKRLYSSGTHNGIDFRASRGTPVKSVLDGTVKAVGNTDEQRGCYSYGKWVLVEHPNGLSTLYAHLDLIKATPNQSVSTGEVLGYSGQTGYATGPHLHLTVYASQGLEIQKYSSSKNCRNVIIPIADLRAYLDPMLYF